MAIYIDLKLKYWSWSKVDALGMLKDALDIIDINIDHDTQILEQSARHAKIEIINEDKMVGIYYMWDHIEKYMRKMYGSSIERVSWDDTERQCGFIY